MLAGGEALALAPVLDAQRPFEEAERVQVLEFDPVAELLASPPAHRDVVHPQVAPLHVDVGDLAVREARPNRPGEGGGLAGGADVGLAHDLDQRHAGAVEVHSAADAGAGDALVHQLSGVLLELDPVDPDLTLSDGHCAGSGERVIVLSDLVALREVRIEVVLPLEDRRVRDLAPEREAGAHRERDRAPVRDRERPGQPVTDRADVGVRRRPETFAQPQKSFVRVFSWTWTSSPMTVSNASGAATCSGLPDQAA